METKNNRSLFIVFGVFLSIPLTILLLVLVLEHREVALVARLGDAMILERRENGTTGFVGVGAVAILTFATYLEYLTEIMSHLGTLHVEGAKALDARRVDDAATGGQVEELAESGGVLTGVVCRTDLGRLGLCFGDETVEQGALPHSTVATEQRDLVAKQVGQSLHALAGLGRTRQALVAQTVVEETEVLHVLGLSLIEEVHLIKHDSHGHAIGLGRSQKAVDEGSRRLGMRHRDHQQGQVDVGRNDMALLREVGGLADDVVATVLDIGYQRILLLFHRTSLRVSSPIGGLRGLYAYTIAHCHRIGAADALEAKVTLHLTIKKLAIVRADGVPTSCILND